MLYDFSFPAASPPLSLSVFRCLLLCFYLLNCVVKNRSRPKPQRRLCARRVYVCVCVCVLVVLGFSAWLRLWLYFGSPISVARSALWGPWAKTKDILIKMLTVSFALPLSLSRSLSHSLSLPSSIYVSLPLKSRPQFDCLPHNLNPLMALWF